MNTAHFDEITAHAGEPVQIFFTVSNSQGDAVSVAGARAAFKIARHNGGPALLSKTESDGIVLSGNTAVVSFGADELSDEDDNPLFGDFVAQLSVTKDGDTLVVAEGRLHIRPVIQ